jgi:diacylglycerol O-acyltransferase / wax synthase
MPSLGRMTEHLTPVDATFLELEQSDEGAHMHIGGVMIFEQQPGGGAPPLAKVRRQLEARLCSLPRYRQRLSSPRTGGLQWPTWEEDESFDINAHVRRARLPGRGTEADLVDWASSFFSERLDRTRPLWEAIVLDGLSGGRWALATKTHHCMVDGVGSVDVATLMLDAEPHPHPRRRAALEEAAPDDETDRGALASLLRLPLRVAGTVARLLRAGAGTATHPARAREALHRSRALAEVLIRDEVVAAPPSSLNVPIRGRRRLGVVDVPLADVKDVKRRLGGTVNDVVLAAATGGLRDLLLGRGETPPAQGLRAMVPVNVRAASERLALGNRITSLFVRLPVGEPDPVERYARQMDEAEWLKSGSQALGATALLDLTGMAPPLVHSFMARSLFATRLFNVTITNVPGPQQPLYSFGSRLEAVWPLVPLAADHTVGIAVFSYDGTLFFTVNADYDAVPDLDVLTAGIRDSISELSAVGAATA